MGVTFLSHTEVIGFQQVLLALTVFTTLFCAAP